MNYLRKSRAIVPRSLLACASVGLSAGVIPLSVSSTGCSASSNQQSIGVVPGMEFDSGHITSGSASDASIGIVVAMEFDAGSTNDAPDDVSVGSIGIRPAMEFDAGASGDAATDVSVGSIGIAPAMNFDADAGADSGQP